MNGRIYDQTINRFTSVDPIIQFPDDMQSYNAYSYVMNNQFADSPKRKKILEENMKRNGGEPLVKAQQHQRGVCPQIMKLI